MGRGKAESVSALEIRQKNAKERCCLLPAGSYSKKYYNLDGKLSKQRLVVMTRALEVCAGMDGEKGRFLNDDSKESTRTEDINKTI